MMIENNWQPHKKSNQKTDDTFTPTALLLEYSDYLHLWNAFEYHMLFDIYTHPYGSEHDVPVLNVMNHCVCAKEGSDNYSVEAI